MRKTDVANDKVKNKDSIKKGSDANPQSAKRKEKKDKADKEAEKALDSDLKNAFVDDDSFEGKVILLLTQIARNTSP
jgi:hypothetical protein